MRPHASPQLAASLRRAQNPGEQLQDGRLAGAVRADDPERLALAGVERHVPDRPELVALQLVLAAHGP